MTNLSDALLLFQDDFFTAKCFVTAIGLAARGLPKDVAPPMLELLERLENDLDALNNRLYAIRRSCVPPTPDVVQIRSK